jgi:hypothetical protein
MFVDLFSFLGTLLSLALSWLAMDCRCYPVAGLAMLCFSQSNRDDNQLGKDEVRVRQ